jgi:hypothetical protein
VSRVTSDGLLKLTKCAGILEGPSVHVGGGCDRDGSGGVNEGKFTGIGFAGGGLSFLQSCCPASRPVCQRQHQRLISRARVKISNVHADLRIAIFETKVLEVSYAKTPRESV